MIPFNEYLHKQRNHDLQEECKKYRAERQNRIREKRNVKFLLNKIVRWVTGIEMGVEVQGRKQKPYLTPPVRRRLP
jgi:hypothetical protein